MIYFEVFSMLLIFITLIVYFKYNLHKNNKFMNIWVILTGFGTLFFAYGTFLTMKINYENSLYKKDVFNKDILSNIFNKDIELFMKYPEIDYFFAQLNGLNYEKKYIRNKTLEAEMSFLIISNISIIIYSIHNNFTDFRVIKEKTNKILNSYLKSPIFLENYFLYKKLYGSDIFNSYMKENFNL